MKLLLVLFAALLCTALDTQAKTLFFEEDGFIGVTTELSPRKGIILDGVSSCKPENISKLDAIDIESGYSKMSMCTNGHCKIEISFEYNDSCPYKKTCKKVGANYIPHEIYVFQKNSGGSCEKMTIHDVYSKLQTVGYQSTIKFDDQIELKVKTTNKLPKLKETNKTSHRGKTMTSGGFFGESEPLTLILDYDKFTTFDEFHLGPVLMRVLYQ